MSKYAAINTPDHRLYMMNFSSPDSTQNGIYVHNNGDQLRRGVGEYGYGWYWTHDHGRTVSYSFKKLNIIKKMEESGIYIKKNEGHLTIPVF